MNDLKIAVTCPNCGASDCQEYRSNCFVCGFRDSTFRWVNSNEITIQHRSAHCSCGKNGVGACTNCNEPICEEHFSNWKAFLACWQQLKGLYWGDNPRLRQPARQQGGMATCHVVRKPGWLTRSFMVRELNQVATGKSHHGFPPASTVTDPVLKQCKMVAHEETDILCPSCVESLFVKLLRPIETKIQQLLRQGRLCHICTVERESAERIFLPMAFLATRSCHSCRIPVCGAHYKFCTKCQQSFCTEHIATTEPLVCTSCRPMGWLKRLFG